MIPATVHELAGAVHGPVETCFLLKILTPPLSFVLVYEPHIEIGIDAHLLARNGIENEPGGYFRDPLRA